jgi:hypothetical protein
MVEWEINAHSRSTENRVPQRKAESPRKRGEDRFELNSDGWKKHSSLLTEGAPRCNDRALLVYGVAAHCSW